MRRVFVFLSSARLAIPALIATGSALAYGTFLESRYDAELARLTIYQTNWFKALLAVLGLNVLCATLARYPFKARDSGVLAVHAGILTVLLGALLTASLGIDGRLQVPESGARREVLLGDVALQVTDATNHGTQTYRLPRQLKPRAAARLEQIDIVGSLPFARATRTFKSTPGSQSVAVSFGIHGPFSDSTEWLTSPGNPKLDLGPALLELVWHSEGAASAAPERAAASSPGETAVLEVVAAEGDTTETIPVGALSQGPVEVDGMRIALTRAYEQAIVGQEKNALAEGGLKAANPALDLSITSQGVTVREVAYAQFPEFTLNPRGIFGHKLRYVTSRQARPALGNLAECHVFSGNPKQVQVRLLKNGSEIMSQWLKPGEVLPTPWQGIQLTLKELVVEAAEARQVEAAEPVPGTALPPSALLVKPAGAGDDEAVWLLEGDSRRMVLGGAPCDVRYGRESLELPFSISLEHLTKQDYPGTRTPMVLDSLVKVNGAGAPVHIDSSAPLQRDGFTLSQAGYVMRRGEPMASVLYVSRDPGRAVAYFGSLIVLVGVLLLTFRTTTIS